MRTVSGTETLVPYLREKTGKARKPTVVVDSREASAAPKIVKGLKERGAEVRVEALPKGDYVISDVCAFERKTVHDFVYTLTRRFLFDQLFGLKELYAKPFILLEGYLPIVYKFSRINPASVWGAMFALAKEGIFMVHTNSYKETVDFLYTAARQEQFVEQRKPVVHPVKKVAALADAQVFLVSSLPNIGREKAIALLETYKTPLNALVNVDSWSKDVRGLGPKISKRAREVLQTPFKEH